VDTSALVSGLLYYIVFLFSTTVHEAAHAWAAKMGGDLIFYPIFWAFLAVIYPGAAYS